MQTRFIYLLSFFVLWLFACDEKQPINSSHLDQDQVMSEDDAELSDVSFNDQTVSDMKLEDMALEDMALEDMALEDMALEDMALEDMALEDMALEDMAFTDSVCLEHNGGCGDAEYFRCEDVNGEAQCSPLVDVLTYPLEPNNMADQNYRVLIAMVNTIGDIPERTEPDLSGNQEFYTAQELGDVYFNDPTGVRQFIHEASYGRVDLYGEVVGWIHTPQTEMSGIEMMTERAQYFEIACQFVDCSVYDIFVLNGLVTGSGTNIGWTMQNSLMIQQGHFMNVGFDYMINSPFYIHGDAYSDGLLRPTASWPHELLHTFGVAGHANSLWCEQDGIAQPLGNQCENKAYGGVFSVMGERAYATHPNFVMKQAMDWIDLDHINLVEITSTFESTRFILSPLEILPAQGEYVGASIRLPNPVEVAGLRLDRLHLEHRAPIGLDSYLLRLDGPNAPDQGSFLRRYTSLTMIDRVGLHLFLDIEYDQSDTTWDIDTHPGTDYNAGRGIKWPGNPGRFADAFFKCG